MTDYILNLLFVKIISINIHYTYYSTLSTYDTEENYIKLI